MPTRATGHRPELSLRLQVESCRGCGRRREYVVRDVRSDPERVIFECPVCGREEALRIRQMLPLAQRDQERLGRTVPRFLLERRWFAGWSLGVPAGWCLRLQGVNCPECGRVGEFWLKDVYDTGPLFGCLTCEGEWHLHLEQIVPFALADQLRLGRPTDRVLQRLTERLLPESDRRPDEAFASLREEALRRGHTPRTLPWHPRAGRA